MGVYIYTHNGILAIKHEIMWFAAPWMDLEIIILSEVRQRKTNTTYHSCGIWNATRTSLQSRTKLTDTGDKHTVTKGDGGEGSTRGLGLTGTNCYKIQHAIKHNGKDCGEGLIYVYMWFTVLVQQKRTQHCKSTILQLKKKSKPIHL